MEEPRLAAAYQGYLQEAINVATGERYIEEVRGRVILSRTVLSNGAYDALIASLDAKQARLLSERQQLAALRDRLSQAAKWATVACDTKNQCDKAFALAQIYISNTASMKIQVATDVIIETFNPTETGSIGMKAIRMPGRGETSGISLVVTCKESSDKATDPCLGKLLDAYEGFAAFIRRSL